MRIYFFNNFTIKLCYQSQNTMCSWMLRTNIQIHWFYFFKRCFIFRGVWLSYIEYTSIQKCLLTYLTSSNELFYIDNVISSILFNIYVYIFLIISVFTILFMFDTSYFRTMNELKYIGDLKKIVFPILNIFLSMAGIPPLLGFCSKFILFIVIFEKINLTVSLLYSFFNLFVIFFYIQNFRFLSTNKYHVNFFNLPVFSKKSFFLSSISFIQFINIFFIFIFEDLVVYLNGVSIFFF